MWIPARFASLTLSARRNSSRSAKGTRRRRAALRLELLEDRTVPAPVLSLNSTVAVANGDVLTNAGQLIALTGGGGNSAGPAPGTAHGAG